jgi:uncharacterized protein (DUF697 family)
MMTEDFESPQSAPSDTAEQQAAPEIIEEPSPALAVPNADVESPARIAAGDSDGFILDQAMLTAACELLPDRLATLTILPLQMRLVYAIGRKHGQALDLEQAQDLAAVFGIGAAAQVIERVVGGTVGSVARGLFGGLFGNATGIAASAAMTFASTFALGHVADRYYAQGRRLSSDDLRSLFTQFQNEAATIYPRVEQRIADLADGNTFDSVLRTIRGTA